MLPGDDRYGDTLSLSGREPHQLVAKTLAVIEPRDDSVLRELGLTALQLWQAASEKQGRGRGECDVTLLFTDLVGFSSWALKAGDERAVELLRQVADITEAAIGRHGGRVVKRLGDGWMAVFPDPQSAVEATHEMQRALEHVEVDGYRPRLRAGVHCGKPRTLGGDYLGVDVNVTARVAEAAKPDQVLVSDAAASRLDPDTVEVGRSKRLKAPGAPPHMRVAPAVPVAIA